RVGFLAQFFDHRGGNLSHSNLLFFETDPGTPGRGQTSTTATRAPDSGAHQERPSRTAQANLRRPPPHHPSGRRDGWKRAQVVRPGKELLFAIVLNFDELFVAFGDLFNHTVKGLIATFEYSVGHTLDVQSDSLARVIVTRNDMLDAFGRMVGINHGHNGNTQRPGFGYGDLVIADVDHEQGVGQVVHVLDAADGLIKLVELTFEHQRFFLGHVLGGAFGLLSFHFLQTLDRAFYGLEVGHHATQPTAVLIRHAATCSFFGDDFASSALGAHKQDGTATSSQLAHELGSFLEFDDSVF